jgi:hypothetical protein
MSRSGFTLAFFAFLGILLGPSLMGCSGAADGPAKTPSETYDPINQGKAAKGKKTNLPQAKPVD